MSEVFINMDYNSNTFWFVHTQHDSDLTDETVIEMCGQSYNCMIHQKQIGYNDKMVVFNIMRDGRIIVVIINHKTFPNMIYPRKFLKNTLIKLFSLTDQTNEVITIMTDGKKYDFYKLNTTLSLNNLKIKKLNIDSVHKILCMKDIDYLKENKN